MDRATRAKEKGRCPSWTSETPSAPPFRASVSSDRPALLFSGTLDGRTLPQAHREIASTLTNSGIVTVEHAGHNLFFSHPRVVPMIADFFEGASPQTTRLTAPAPEWR